jgi:ribonuclease HII
VGVDENGLGPRLGPLVVTACALACSRLDDSAAQRAGAALGIADSKVSSGFGSMAHAEGLALAVAERAAGRTPRDADDVLAALGLDGLLALRAPCPVRSRPQCWGALPVPAFGGRIDQGRAILAGLGAGRCGVSVVRVRSAILCARTYNDAVARLGSKLAVDLHLFERLLLDARRASGADLRAVCGMVGGIRRYAERFTLFDAADVEVVEEGKACARYRIRGLGDVGFEVDADARALPVSLASMVGKYLRELWMARQNAFYRGLDPRLPAASGYHDPVTRRLVEATEALRAERGIDTRCFERER